MLKYDYKDYEVIPWKGMESGKQNKEQARQTEDNKLVGFR